jgi:hypothetical protein
MKARKRTHNITLLNHPQIFKIYEQITFDIKCVFCYPQQTCVVQMVEALYYKPEGRRFES